MFTRSFPIQYYNENTASYQNFEFVTHRHDYQSNGVGLGSITYDGITVYSPSCSGPWQY